MMYSNIGLSFREPLPLKGLSSKDYGRCKVASINGIVALQDIFLKGYYPVPILYKRLPLCAIQKMRKIYDNQGCIKMFFKILPPISYRIFTFSISFTTFCLNNFSFAFFCIDAYIFFHPFSHNFVSLQKSSTSYSLVSRTLESCDFPVSQAMGVDF